MLGAYARTDGAAAVTEDLERAYAMFPILSERRAQSAGTFSGGEQQMLAMGRALMCRPELLMLDEPSMGLSPIMMQKIMSRRSPRCGSRAPRSCWSSRTPRRRCRWPTRGTSWRSATSSSPGRAASC